MAPRDLFRRWTAFNAVGALGVAVQLGVLAMLIRVWHVPYLAATALAVEAAVLHNFVWHQRWTWKDRGVAAPAAIAGRLARFHLLNGSISIVGNVALTALLAGLGGVDPILANILAIAICSVANFAASETMVFRTAAAAGGFVLVFAPGAAWAGPSAGAASAWRDYESRVDARYAGSAGFFVHDASGSAPGWRDLVARGGVSMIAIDPPSIDGAQVHHWVGAVFVPHVTLRHVLDRLQANAGRESSFHDDVLASRLLRRDGDRLSVFLKLRRESVITVTYNTEHAVEFRRLAPARAASRSLATRIAELADAGTPREREKADGDDNGFLWRLNAYWRYEEIAGGVLIECESVSLSRSVPALLRPFVGSMVERIARESLEKTLKSVKGFVAKG